MRRPRRRDERIVAFDGPVASASTSFIATVEFGRVPNRRTNSPTWHKMPPRSTRGAFDQVAAHDPRAVRRCERQRRSPDVVRRAVAHHRALAARIVEEAFGDAQLEHPSRRRRMRGGLGERVPRAEPHADKCSVVRRGASDQSSAAPSGPIALSTDRRRASPRCADARSTRSTSIRRSAPARSARPRPRYADRADDPDAFVAWLSPLLVEQPPRARADRLLVRPPRLPRRPLREGRPRSAVRARAARQRDRVVLRGRRQEPARLRPQARHHLVVRERRRTGRSIPMPSGCRGAAAAHAARRTADGAVQEKTDKKTGRVYRYPVAAGKVPETGGPTSRPSTIPTASARAGRPRSRSG